MTQPWEYHKIRPDIKQSLDGYASGERPFIGDFLRAVLAHDLFESVGRADQDNLEALPAIVGYIYNMLPGNCHGSYEIVDAWIEARTVIGG